MLEKKVFVVAGAVVVVLVAAFGFFLMKGSNSTVNDDKGSISTDVNGATSTDTTTDAGSVNNTTGSTVVNTVGPTKLTEVRDNVGTTIDEKFKNFVKDLQDYDANTYTNGKFSKLEDRNKAAKEVGSKVFSNVTYFVTGTPENKFSNIGVVAEVAGGKVCKAIFDFSGKTRESIKIVTTPCTTGTSKEVVSAAEKEIGMLPTPVVASTTATTNPASNKSTK